MHTHNASIFQKISVELIVLEHRNDTLYIGFESRTYGQNIVLHIGIMSFFAFFEDANSEYVILNGHIWGKSLNLVSPYWMLMVLEHPNNILTCKLKADLFCNVTVVQSKTPLVDCLKDLRLNSLSCRGPDIYKHFLRHWSFSNLAGVDSASWEIWAQWIVNVNH